ncbi:MAG: hypothetical protein CSB06_01550 [Bacteroidia bacterium]|nr:MAG: hypothetical protein CSB06_01550 [Bacteroidia bacterium]
MGESPAALITPQCIKTFKAIYSFEMLSVSQIFPNSGGLFSIQKSFFTFTLEKQKPIFFEFPSAFFNY